MALMIVASSDSVAPDWRRGAANAQRWVASHGVADGTDKTELAIPKGPAVLSPSFASRGEAATKRF
jgi:hypothetical protein